MSDAIVTEGLTKRYSGWRRTHDRPPALDHLDLRVPSGGITGVLGPHSNAHGPNEFIDLDYAKRLTACVAHVIAAHAVASGTRSSVPAR